MEIKVYQDTVTAGQVICDTKQELSVEAEILIPDYLPQVFKIVKCFVSCVVLQKQFSAGRLTVEGYLRCVVLYQSEEAASLCRAEHKLPFTKQVELSGENTGAAHAWVSGQTEYVNCRAISGRRVDVRGAFLMNILAMCAAQQPVLTALSGEGVEQKTQALQHVEFLCAPEKLCTAQCQILFSAAPDMVLDTQCTVAVDEVKLIEGTARAPATMCSRQNARRPSTRCWTPPVQTRHAEPVYLYSLPGAPLHRMRTGKTVQKATSFLPRWHCACAYSARKRRWLYAMRFLLCRKRC